jgi:sporulation protein YlmC with PRC-barrel domain
MLNGLYDRAVVAVAEGLQLGPPADLLLDMDQHRLAYVVVSYGAVPDLGIVAPASAIGSLKGDALAIHGLAALDLAFRDQHALELLRRGVRIVDLPVVTDDGQELGSVQDVELDEHGTVVNYIVRRSGVGRLLRNHRVPPTEVRTVGQVMTVARPKD